MIYGEHSGHLPEVREWPVLRLRPTRHLDFNRFVLCRVCEELQQKENG